MSKVVHCKRAKYDVYIGRVSGNPDESFGNPFGQKGIADVIVPSRTEAISRFEAWLAGEADQDVCPGRREYILSHIHELKGKVLGCWCAPLPCHGELLVELANKEEEKES